jgi:acetyl-CoA carboxylase biotin carboxyl carrier protein
LSLSTQEIKEIIAILEDSGWDEAELVVGDVTLTVSKSGNGLGARSIPSAPAVTAAPAAVQPSAAPAPTAPAAASVAAPSVAAIADGQEGTLVVAPSVGVFWRSPQPGAPPFVEVGDAVKVGQTLCIVEVMKLMQQVLADVDGVITGIHAENSQNVEFGTPLFTIRPGTA